MSYMIIVYKYFTLGFRNLVLFQHSKYFVYPTLWYELSVKICVPHPMAAYENLCKSVYVRLQRGNGFISDALA